MIAPCFPWSEKRILKEYHNSCKEFRYFLLNLLDKTRQVRGHWQKYRISVWCGLSLTKINVLLCYILKTYYFHGCFMKYIFFLPSFLLSAPVMAHQRRKILTQIGWSLCGSPSFINAAVNLALLSRILKIC